MVLAWRNKRNNSLDAPFYRPFNCIFKSVPDSKVHGAYVGPTWGRQDPGGPHVGHMILAIWGDQINGNETIKAPH